MKNNIKLSIASILSVAVLFTACGKDSDQAKAYDIQLALDSGDNQKVIDLLGDCSQYSGTQKDKCYLDLGAAYFGEADFDMISMAQEFANISDDLNSSEKSKKFNEIVFSKLDNKNLQLGINQYKKIVDNNSSVCTESNYDSLKSNSQQACISINPLLLSEIIDDDNKADDNKSTSSVSLEQIIEFKDVLKDAVPELSSSDLVSVFNGGDVEPSKDANNNDKLDSVEATTYAIEVFAMGKQWKGDANVSSDFNRTVNYTHTALKDKNITLSKITIKGVGNNNNSFYRLVEYTKDYNTTLTTIPDTVCNPAHETLTTASLSDILQNQVEILIYLVLL
jgi:hypothetical protein